MFQMVRVHGRNHYNIYIVRDFKINYYVIANAQFIIFTRGTVSSRTFANVRVGLTDRRTQSAIDANKQPIATKMLDDVGIRQPLIGYHM